MPDPDRLVEIRGSNNVIQQYRQLLRSDWSQATMYASVNLFFDLLRDSGVHVSFVDSEEASPSAEYPIPPQASSTLVRFLEILNDRVQVSNSQREQNRKQQGESDLFLWMKKVIYCLIFQFLANEANVRTAGDTDLLADIQSLVFNLAVTELMPLLRDSPELAEFINMALAYCSMESSRDGAHASFLRALLFEELGQLTEAEECLKLAASMTPSRAHDYLTKQQALWSLYMEQGRAEEAESLVLSLYRDSPQEHLEEIRDLVRQTFSGLQRPPRRRTIKRS